MIDLDPVNDDQTALRKAYGCFPSGIAAVCALTDGTPDGIAASSFTTVSLDPPLVSVCVQHTSRTWPRLVQRPRLGVSVLGAGQDAACRQLASKTGDRFAGLDWVATAQGAVLLRPATLWLDCALHDTVTAGDHDVVLLRVTALRVHPDVAPLVFHASTFRQLEAA